MSDWMSCVLTWNPQKKGMISSRAKSQEKNDERSGISGTTISENFGENLIVSKFTKLDFPRFNSPLGLNWLLSTFFLTFDT